MLGLLSENLNDLKKDLGVVSFSTFDIDLNKCTVKEGGRVVS